MRLSRTFGLSFTVVLAVAALAGPEFPSAPRAPERPSATAESAPQKPRLKRGTRWFLRPHEATPAAQMQYAGNLRRAGALRAAARAYNALVHRWPDAPEAPTAQLALAEVEEARGRYQAAFDEYQYLVDHYPGRFPFGEVLQRQFALANALQDARRMRLLFLPGFAAPERALPLFEKIAANAPLSELAAEARFRIGVIHEQNGDYDEAIQAYEAVLSDFANTAWAPRAALAAGRCLYTLSRRARRSDSQLVEAAHAALARFVRAWPRDPGVEEARRLLRELDQRRIAFLEDQARFYDRRARRSGYAPRFVKAACISYQELLDRFPGTDAAKRAQQRLEELRIKERKQEDGS